MKNNAVEEFWSKNHLGKEAISTENIDNFSLNTQISVINKQVLKNSYPKKKIKTF